MGELGANKSNGQSAFSLKNIQTSFGILNCSSTHSEVYAPKPLTGTEIVSTLEKRVTSDLSEMDAKVAESVATTHPVK